MQSKLYGVLYHHGESAGSGNYTVDVLHPNGDSGSGEAWLHIDDEVVSAVSHEDVFEGHDNEWMDNQCAYMLFYCRYSDLLTCLPLRNPPFIVIVNYHKVLFCPLPTHSVKRKLKKRFPPSNDGGDCAQTARGE